MILRCTKKLLDVISPEHLSALQPDRNDWYTNLLVLDWRKCFLLTHVDSLFTVFEPDVRATDLRSPHDLVAGLIERELLAEGLPVQTFGDLAAEELSTAKTADRSVLGCMNDMAYLCDDAVARAGSLASAAVRSLNRRLRRNINSARTTNDQSTSPWSGSTDNKGRGQRTLVGSEYRHRTRSQGGAFQRRQRQLRCSSSAAARPAKFDIHTVLTAAGPVDSTGVKRFY